MTTLQGLYDTLERARLGGSLTLSAGSAGAGAIDDFLATLPARSLTLRKPQIQLKAARQPATLVVSGAMDASWALPGLTAHALSTQTATVTYQQNGQAAPVTADLAVTATISVGRDTIRLNGSLGANSLLRFEWSQGGQGNLSLADAAALATDGRAVSYLPADVPLFDNLQLSSFTLSLGYAPGATTTMEFSLTAGSHATWEILPGQHVLTQIGVTCATAYRISPGAGARHSFGGNIHATLDLGQNVSVVIGLDPSDVWEMKLTGSAGLPAIGTIAAIAAAQDEVRTGLQAVGLGDITLQSVHLGINRATRSLAFITMQGSMSIAGKAVEVYAQLPDFTLGGSLSSATPISLTALLESTLGTAGGLPDIEISKLSLSAAPQSGGYSLAVQIDDGQLAVGDYGLTDVSVDIDKQGGGTAGGISAAIAVAGSQILVSGSYGPGWTVSGQLDELSLAALTGEVLADVGLPSPLANLQLTGVSASWNLSTGAFGFSGEVDLGIELGPRTLASKLRLAVESTVDARSKTRTTTGSLAGSLSLGGMAFDLRYDLTPGRQVLTGTWNAQGSAGFAALAGAFGIAVPAGDVTLPDLRLTSLSFALDWGKSGQQAVRLTAVTSIGEAFFIVDRPQPGQPWAFAFGAAVAGAARLSQVLGPVGLNVTALDFIHLGGAFFLVASAPFPSLQVPGFAPLAGQHLQVSPGITAAVLVDLGGTADRPDVVALKTLLAGRPPVLLGELTLRTSLTAIAVTVQLDGGLKIAGAGASSLTLADVSLILKPEPVALTMKGSIEFPVGSATLLATGLLTVGLNGLTAAFDVHGENGSSLPFPMGLPGVHLTDIGIEIGVTLEPPSVELGLLGRFVIGPGLPPPPQGQVPARPLSAMPPADQFVMIFGLEGEVPNPLLLSMYLQELSLGKAVEAFTNTQPQGLPAVLNDVSASDLMIYWCDAPAGLQQPDGTWAYPGFGFNAIVDCYRIRSYAELTIDSARGISGAACIDPIGIHGVIDLTGNGKGTPATYRGQATVRPGGAQIKISTIASPYLDISWRLVLFSTVSESVNAQLIRSGFTFEVSGSASGFASSLACTFQLPGQLAMAFSVLLNTDVDLGTISGVHLGHVHLAGVALAGRLAADASPSLRITIDGAFEFDGASFAMPRISVSEPFSSLSDIPAAIQRQVENDGAAIFAGFRATAAVYLDVIRRSLVIAGDEIGKVLRTGYSQTADQAAAAMKTAGYAARDVASALRFGYNDTGAQAAQALKDAGYGISDIGDALTSVWGATANDVANELKSAGYSVSDAGNYIKSAFNLAPDQLHAALQGAGYAADEVSSAFGSLGSGASTVGHYLDPSNW